MNNLDWQKAVGELTDAVNYLAMNGKKVGVVGFCMGGALSLAAAQHSGVAASAPFYGTPPKELCQVRRAAAPSSCPCIEEDAEVSASDTEHTVELTTATL